MRGHSVNSLSAKTDWDNWTEEQDRDSGSDDWSRVQSCDAAARRSERADIGRSMLRPYENQCSFFWCCGPTGSGGSRRREERKAGWVGRSRGLLRRNRLVREQRVRPVKLFAGHDLREILEALGAGLLTGTDGAGVPSIRGDVIEGQTLAMFREITKEGKGTRMALIGGKASPPGG